jgi:hypothetical protein
MARIRSIKPEFWCDGGNLELSDSCALFFIGLWNFCDDEGKHRFNLNQLVAELGGRWRKDKVSLFIVCLMKSGQLRISSNSEWIQVTGWSHQKIDKPKQPEIKSSELQWLSADESAKALDDSRTINARIGSDRRDRRGSDQGSKKDDSPNVRELRPVPLPEPKAPAPEKTHLVIAAYCDSWKSRYRSQENPPVGGKNAGLLKILTKDLGYEKAIRFVEGYLQMPDSWFATKRHDVPTLMQNLNAVAQFIETGVMFSKQEIRDLDRQVANSNTLDALRRGEV